MWLSVCSKCKCKSKLFITLYLTSGFTLNHFNSGRNCSLQNQVTLWGNGLYIMNGSLQNIPIPLGNALYTTTIQTVESEFVALPSLPYARYTSATVQIGPSCLTMTADGTSTGNPLLTRLTSVVNELMANWCFI